MALSTDDAPAAPEPEVSAGWVVDYLRRHPDFLAANPELLDHLTPPSRATGNGVRSLYKKTCSSRWFVRTPITSRSSAAT